MNNHKITGLSSNITNDADVVNKQQVDTKPNPVGASHTLKNVFQYLTDDLNEWSTEYGLTVEQITIFTQSFYAFEKKALFITAKNEK